jgi:hypothetical protein
MYKILLPVLLIFAVFSLQAQNRAVIKGHVLDSLNNQPLEFATVALVDVKDTAATSLISYTITDKKGAFALHDLPAGTPIKILVTFVSYKPFRKIITLTKAQEVDLGNIILNPKQLNEVTITSERPPIIIKKDTIEFAAEAFKTRPNAVVEELLKKLPGIEVDNEGNIKFNGKKVNKVLVDGREFFANDLRIATKNLDAELIDKVQVYDDRENDPDHLIPEVNVEKIINLKFKKKLKKSLFGKVYAGGATESRYESGALINLFRDTLQVSLLGLSNNLSSTGFDFNDLYSYGGLNRGGNGSGFGGGGGFFGRPGGSGSIQQTTQGGFNINTDYGKKLKVNLVYYYNNTNTTYNTLNTRDQFTSDTDFTTSSAGNRVSTDQKHTLNLTVRAQPNASTQITYNPQFSYGNTQSNNNSNASSFSNFVPLVNKTTSTDSAGGNNWSFQQSFNFNRQLKKQGSSINIDHSFSVNPDNNNDVSKSALTSFVSTFPSYTLNRFSNSHDRNVAAGLGLTYRYPVTKKLNLSINIGTDYNQNINQNFTYDFNPSTGLYDLYLQPQSNDLTRNLWKQHLTTGLTYPLTKTLNLVANVTAQYQQVNNRFGRGLPDLNQHYLDFLPSLTLSAGNYTSGSYSLGYAQSLQLPNIGDEIPYTVVFSPLYSVTGNPDLKLTRRHNFSLGYNRYNTQKQTNVFMGGNFSITENDVFRDRTLDNVGAETSTPINRSGAFNSYINGSFGKQFKKRHDLSLHATTGFTLSQNHNFFEINHQYGFQNRYSANINEQFSINWKDIITLDPSYNISQSLSIYSGVNYANVNTTTQTFTTPYTIYWPAHTDITGTYTYIYNSLVSPGYQKSSNLLNIAIARQFLKKDRAEIKLSCYDILNQAISSSRSVYENVVSDSQSQIVKRYFMVTLRWKFNSSTYQEKKSMMMGPMMRLR